MVAGQVTDDAVALVRYRTAGPVVDLEMVETRADKTCYVSFCICLF